MKTLAAFIVIFSLSLFVSSCTDNSIIPTPGTNQTDGMIFTITGSADGLTTAPAGMDKPYRHFEGSGQSSPGGNCQVMMDYWAIPTGPLSGYAKFGNATLVSETGDKMYGINLGGTYTIDPITYIVTCDVHFNLAGGTGDYDNVIGLVNLAVTLNPDRTTHADWNGTFERAKPFSSNEFTGINGTVINPVCTGNYVRRHAEGDGFAQHLGKYKAVTEHCINFTTGILSNGDGNFIASDGDQVHATYDGYAVPIPGTNKAAIKMFCTINGGTGKFASATGYLLVTGTQILPEGEAICSFDGVIDY